MPGPRASRRNLGVAAACFAFVVTMVGAAFAAVPLYQLFCQVTGYGGATRRVDSADAAVLEDTVTVRFDANVAPDLPWTFGPIEPSVEVRLGEVTTVWYTVTNRTGRPSAGVATFNVTPIQGGAYFSKLDCFCFDEQVLAPHETREMAVVFFVDPAMLADQDAEGLSTLTLSYTFFSARLPAAPVAAASTADGSRPNL